MSSQTALKMPTGIGSLDPVLNGGVIPGSLIILLSDIGAGSAEFAYTSFISLARRRGEGQQGVILPRELRYISITRTQEDVSAEIRRSFKSDMTEGIIDQIVFRDLSRGYFERSIVPPSWYDGQGGIVARMQRKKTEHGSVIADLIAALDEGGDQNLVIIDSLTDIAGLYTDPEGWSSLVAFLRGLQRMAKNRDTTLLLHLTRGVLESSRELEICDCADAVILFRWEEGSGKGRQRIMYFLKFRGVMPYLEDRDLVKFAIRISASAGFDVENIRMVI